MCCEAPPTNCGSTQGQRRRAARARRSEGATATGSKTLWGYPNARCASPGPPDSPPRHDKKHQTNPESPSKPPQARPAVAPRPWMPQRASEGKACRPALPRRRTYPHTGPVHWVPYNQGRPGRHGSPPPGGLTMATLSGGGGLYLEPGVPTRPASV